MKKPSVGTIARIVLALIGVAAIVMAVFVREIYEYFYIIAIVGAALTAAAVVLLLPKSKDKVKLDSKYRRKTRLVTPCEYDFMLLLKQIEPQKYEVLPQIALVSVIDKITNTSYRNELFRIADFCFVDKDTYEPLLLVELNDASHERADRKERDEKVNAICKAAGLPLVTFTPSDVNDYRHVRKTVLKNIL